MANENRPSGLSPVKHLTGAPYNGQANTYFIDHTVATAIAIGDPVVLNNTMGPAGHAGVKLAAAGGEITGVVVGVGTHMTVVANLENPDSLVRPASTSKDWYALVVDDPNVIFEVQASGNVADAKAGTTGDLTAGTDNGFVSGWQLDASNVDGDGTDQVTLISRAPRVDNEAGTNAKWLVRINKHTFSMTADTSA